LRKVYGQYFHNDQSLFRNVSQTSNRNLEISKKDENEESDPIKMVNQFIGSKYGVSKKILKSSSSIHGSLTRADKLDSKKLN